MSSAPAAEPFVVLGAERQAATSIALAMPNRTVVFAADRHVVDGWDLENVKLVWREADAGVTSPAPTSAPTDSDPASADPASADPPGWIALHERWLTPHTLALPGAPRNRLHDLRLSSILAALAPSFSDHVLPVHDTPPPAPWIRKGDRGRRDDAVVTDERPAGAPPRGAACVYQRRLHADGTVLATGFRGAGGAVSIGAVHVHAETFGREDVLLAGETIDAAAIIDATVAMLADLEHTGPFTGNWILTPDGPRLTSLRAVPRAVVRCLRAAGIDPLAPPPEGVARAAAGSRFVVDAHYAPYRTTPKRGGG